jgi:hypothetical protein
MSQMSYVDVHDAACGRARLEEVAEGQVGRVLQVEGEVMSRDRATVHDIAQGGVRR